MVKRMPKLEGRVGRPPVVGELQGGLAHVPAVRL
jgi:hypothetical protein